MSNTKLQYNFIFNKNAYVAYFMQSLLDYDSKKCDKLKRFLFNLLSKKEKIVIKKYENILKRKKMVGIFGHGTDASKIQLKKMKTE